MDDNRRRTARLVVLNGIICHSSLTHGIDDLNYAAANTLRDSVHERDGSLRVPLWPDELEEYGLYIDDAADEFSFGGTQVNCYVTPPFTADNSRNLSEIGSEIWLTQEIKSKLNLASGKWVFEDGKPPELSL